jgi:glycosyltransferase involved in cell wall biosynthesis
VIPEELNKHTCMLLESGNSAHSGDQRGLRVALVGPFPAEEGKVVGGVEGVTAALGDGLAGREGVEVHAVTCVHGLAAPEVRRRSSGVIVHLVPLFGKAGNLTFFAVDVARILSVLKEIDPDVVHAHTQLFYARAAQKSGKPAVLTIHGIIYREAALQRGWTRLRTRLAGLYDRSAVRAAKHMTFINHYAAECYAQWVRTTDIRYIGNPIDDRFFSVQSDAEPGRVLFGGTIGRRKDPLVLLRAAAGLVENHPNLKVRIAGKVIEEDYHQGCLDFVAEHKLESHVDFLGSVSIDIMMEELARANALVLPSNQETAPVIISEAMAAGTPVVTTPAGGSAEMVEDGKAGFVIPFGDDTALATAIGKLLDDAQLRARMGRYARSEAERRYKCSVVVDKTLAFYEDILRDAK